jgi:protein-S-isoprenylcysteine O-methyltransferase Ste14
LIGTEAEYTAVVLHLTPAFVASVVTGSFVAYIAYAYWLRARSRRARGPSLAERGGLAKWLPAFVWVPYLVIWLRPGPEVTLPLPVVVGLAVSLAGIAFAIWAAATLGRHFDVEVQVHRGHEVVRSGPYGIVRHPIYTGLAIHYLGACLATGNLVLIAGTLAVTIPSLYLRARAEEDLLRSELGEPYDRYARDVPMLVPFIGR